LPRDHAYTLEPGRPTPGSHNLLRPPIASQLGIGLLTDFPSATRFRLTLGADSPCADERCAGNLGLSATRPFTLFIATHVSIRTSDTSSKAYTSPSQAYGTLSYRDRNQKSEDRSQKHRLLATFPTSTQSLQHLGDLLVLVAPPLPSGLVNVPKIHAIAHPDPHLIRRSNGHLQEPFELRHRVALLGKALSDVDTDGFAATEVRGQKTEVRTEAYSTPRF